MDEDEIGLGRVLEAIHSYEYEAESKDGSKRLVFELTLAWKLAQIIA